MEFRAVIIPITWVFQLSKLQKACIQNSKNAHFPKRNVSVILMERCNRFMLGNVRILTYGNVSKRKVICSTSTKKC